MSTSTLAPARAALCFAYPIADDPLLLRRARTWWTVAGLFLMSAANGFFLTPGKHYDMKTLKMAHDTSHGLLPLTLAMVAICIALMARHTRSMLQLMLQQKALLAFPVLAVLSTLWSQVPGVTFRKATLLFLLGFAFTCFLVSYYSPGDQMRILLATGAVVAVACVAWAILLPQYGISTGGAWKGIFSQKNRMGISLLFLFSGLPFCSISGRRRVQTLALHSLLPCGLIFLSLSRTAWVLTVVVIAIRIFGPVLTRTRREKIPFLLYGAGFGLAAIAVSVGALLQMLGRDLTFTGRTKEWADIAPFTLNHFWLGYGYQGFWVGNTGDSGTLSHMIAGQNVADNGFLDAMLQFGFVGMVMLVVVLVVCTRDFRNLLRGPYVPLVAYWYAALIVATLIGSFSETLLLPPGGIDTFMFVLGCAGLRRLSMERSSQRVEQQMGQLYAV